MALSNMLREPRREIIETLIGGTILCMVVYICYFFAINWPILSIKYVWDLLANMGIWFVIGGLVWLFLIFIHFIGEEICDSLQRNGIRIRPRRY